MKKAAIVTLWGHPREQEVMRSLKKEGYEVLVPPDEQADLITALNLKAELAHLYDRIVTVSPLDLIR